MAGSWVRNDFNQDEISLLMLSGDQIDESNFEQIGLLQETHRRYLKGTLKLPTLINTKEALHDSGKRLNLRNRI